MGRFRDQNFKTPHQIIWSFSSGPSEEKQSIRVHGPVIETKSGAYAIRFAGMKDIGQVEQWYRMNKSTSMEEWLEAMSIRSIVSFNAVYADKKKNILFLHNAASPVREESIDWTQPVDGTKSALIWNELVPLEQLPLIINPSSGWLASNNQDPFKVTSRGKQLKSRRLLSTSRTAN